MNLFTLLRPFLDTLPQCADVLIQGLQNDNRQIQSGDLFIAYPGALADGRQYIEQAIQAGAVAILYEPKNFLLDPSRYRDIPLIALPHASQKLAQLASRFYANPSEKLSITGVTGTNGKTTIAYQLAQAYPRLGRRASYIGTLGQGEVHALKALANTTPDALCVQQLLHDNVEEGIGQVCMEVSSHALSLGRVDCVHFKQAIYTNLSHEHLDFHHTMEHYAAAKASLFARDTLQAAIINHDDAHHSLMLKRLPSGCQRFLYGLNEGADVRALQWETHMSGSSVEVLSPWGRHHLQLQTLGQFNIYNSLAVFTSLMASQIAPLDAVLAVMRELQPSPGRMEIVSRKPCVIVDYAHTPDALDNVLKTLAALQPQRLWLVFGCGGDRDSTKRPMMGRIASQYATDVILTNDNPRTEDPNDIIQDILKGMPIDHSIQVLPDRKAAIDYALHHAGPEDMVLIAGKGHEDYQIIGHQRFSYSDQAVVRGFLGEK